MAASRVFSRILACDAPVKNVIVAVSAAFLSVVAAVLRLGLWKYDLRVPITYWGDALYETVMVKGLIEGSWNYHIARLGAPFVMDAVDFPIGCSLDFAIIKILSFAIREPGLLINVYWILSISMAAAGAALFLRSVRISASLSIAFGMLYGVIPFTFYRNIAHLNLVHFVVPGAVYLATSLALGRSIFMAPLPNRKKINWRDAIIAIGISLAIGFAYIYWAFFACIAICAGWLIGRWRFGQNETLLTAIIYLFTIAIAATANESPSLVYWHRHGQNTALEYKRPAEADIYGLKIRQMLSPIREHPLAIFRRVRDKLVTAGFPHDDNESATAALGTIGSIGFICLLFNAIVGDPSERRNKDSRLEILAGIVLVLLLVATVGGFGSLFNVFVLREFRCYNRISPFISLLAFAALAVIFDHLFRSIKLWMQATFAFSLGFLGVFDQVPKEFFRYHAGEEVSFWQDRDFIAHLESRLPKDLMVFQMPNTGFPPDGPHQRMQPYDNARAYLHSKKLRWSWGAMDGRHGDWAKTVAGSSVPEFLRSLVIAGFGGLLIDRFGYSNNCLLDSVLATVELSVPSEIGARWTFIDLREFARRTLEGMPESQRLREQSEELHPVTVEWSGSFSVEEANEHQKWRWCGKHGVIRIVNNSNAERSIDLNATLQQAAGGKQTLRMEVGNDVKQIELDGNPVLFRPRVMVKGMSSQDIDLTYSGPLLSVPGDSRDIAFRVVNFRIARGH